MNRKELPPLEGPLLTRSHRPHSPPLVTLLVTLWVALTAILAGINTPVQAAVAAGTRVGANTVAVDVLVGPPGHKAASQRLGNYQVGVVSAVATGVAAKTGSGRLSTVLASGERGAIGRGTPRTNSAQNKQFNDAIKDGERQLGRTLSKDERSAVHREISGQDYGYHDIVDEVLGMFGGGK